MWGWTGFWQHGREGMEERGEGGRREGVGEGREEWVGAGRGGHTKKRPEHPGDRKSTVPGTC